MEFITALMGIIGLILFIVLFDRTSRLDYRLKQLERKQKPSAEETAAEDDSQPFGLPPQTAKQQEEIFPPKQQTQPDQQIPSENTPAVLASAAQPPINTPENTSVSEEQAAGEQSPLTAAEETSLKQDKPFIDWENFTIAKLFSWIGGFILLLAAAFGVKYSLDNNLISPALRMACGALLGLGLLAAGLFIKKKELQTTANTLAGCGLAMLYLCTFASYTFYTLFSMQTAFVLMAAVGLLSFSVAVWKNAKYIGFLAEITCFLTPFLLASDSPNVIFFLAYVAFINAAAAFTAFKRGWNGLLIGAAICTFLCQCVAADSCLREGGNLLAFCFFSILYTSAAAFAAQTYRESSAETTRHTLGLFITVNLAFPLFGITNGQETLAAVLPLLGLTLWLNGLLAGLAYKDKDIFHLPLLFGKILVFLFLFCWTQQTGDIPPLLLLCAFLAFAAINAGTDLLAYKKQAHQPGLMAIFFPVLLMLPLLFKSAQAGAGNFLVCVAVMVFLLSLCAVCALLAGKPLTILGACALFIVTLLAADTTEITAGPLWVLSLGAVPSLLIFAAARWLLHGQPQDETKTAITVFISALMPYVLLISLIFNTEVSISLFFGFALLFNLLCLLFAYLYKNTRLLPGALAGSTLAQACYIAAVYMPASLHGTVRQIPVIGWISSIFAVFFLIPFLCKKRFWDQQAPWAAASLSGIAAMLLIRCVQYGAEQAPGNGWMALIFALIYILGIFIIYDWAPAQEPTQRKRLAWLGGGLLFFITLFFPLQFSKGWLTVSWALEGAALIWLNRRLEVKGLRLTGFFLLIAVFLRLWFATVDTEPVESLFNRYLYIFGISAASMLGAAGLWKPEEEKGWIKWLAALGGIALFMLMNLEIAYYFSPESLRFDIFGPFSSAIAYTVGWMVFGAGCLFLGLHKRGGTRTVGIGLVSVALLKLFFSDIWALGGLYRIGGLAGTAVILLLISFIYQQCKHK